MLPAVCFAVLLVAVLQFESIVARPQQQLSPNIKVAETSPDEPIVVEIPLSAEAESAFDMAAAEGAARLNLQRTDEQQLNPETSSISKRKPSQRRFGNSLDLLDEFRLYEIFWNKIF